MPQIYIETPRLILRSWQTGDHEPFIELNRDKAVMQFFPAAMSPEETLRQVLRIRAHFEQYGYGFFALERKNSGQFIGFTGFSHPSFQSYFTPCVEIGWRLSREHWRQGFATEAARACLQYGFVELGFEDIYSFTSVHNKASEKVMIRAGMKKQDEFDHPAIQEGHFLRKHVLYKISASRT
ncbi:MAG: GNAT family N-acetyltransferase [Bacteroidetes bacterium]|nr:GNAT family N-acetyltransferase [Bacteroidota bacterium]